MIEEIKLGDLFLLKGKSVNPLQFKNEIFELYSIPAYDTGYPEIVKGKDIGSSKKELKPGDVVISRIVPHIRRCWIIPDNNQHRKIGSGEWIVFRSSKIYNKFLRYFLLSDLFNRMFMKTIKGVGGSLMRADPKQVGRFNLSLPPLDNQKKIAAILDEADKLRQLDKTLIEKYDALTQSLFLDMFGDPVANSKGWEEVIFTEVMILRRGFDLPVQDRIKGDYPIMASNGILDWHNQFKVKGPGVITGRSGTLGKVHFIESDYWPLNTSLYSQDLKENNPIYILYLLRNFRVERFSRGAGVPTLNRNLVHAENIMFVPIKLQNQFSERVQAIEAQKALAQQSLLKSEELFNSLLQKAFKWELV